MCCAIGSTAAGARATQRLQVGGGQDRGYRLVGCTEVWLLVVGCVGLHRGYLLVAQGFRDYVCRGCAEAGDGGCWLHKAAQGLGGCAGVRGLCVQRLQAGGGGCVGGCWV